MNVERFLSEQPYSQQTTDTYRLILSRFSDWLTEAGIDLSRFTSQDFDRYAGKGWSSNYLYVQVSAIRAYIRWAMDPDRGNCLSKRPQFMSKSAPKRSQSMGLRALTLDEVRQLTDFLLLHRGRGTYRRTLAMMLLSFDCGLRATEVCNINMLQLDLDARQVTVMRKRSEVTRNGFGELTAWAIRAYLADRPTTKDRRLFVTDEGLPLNRQAWRLICLRLAKAAGVPHFGPHALRRATAIRYREQGAPIADVLQRMGWHGQAGMQLYRHYSQLFAADPLAAFMPSAGLMMPVELQEVRA